MRYKIDNSDKIFIAGSSGMVGSAIKRKLLESGYGLSENDSHLFTPSRKELDLTNYNQVKEFIVSGIISENNITNISIIYRFKILHIVFT